MIGPQPMPHATAIGSPRPPPFTKARPRARPRAAAEPAREELRAARLLVALDALEEERRTLLLEDAPGDRAELAIPVDLRGDPAQLAFLLEPPDPLAHVHVRHQPTIVSRAPRVFVGSRAPGVGALSVAA